MLRAKGGDGGRGTNKGCPCAAVESKIAKLSLEIAKLRHRVACQEQSWTRCAIPLPHLHCAQTVHHMQHMGTNKGPCAAVEYKIAKLSLEIAKLRHRVACQEQSCHRRTRCAIPLPRLHCAQTVHHMQHMGTKWGYTNLHTTEAALPCVCNVPQGRP